jgi:WD40 repeat protein
VAWSPDGKLLATGAYNTVRLWDAEDGRELLNLKQGGVGSPTLVAWSPNGKELAAAGGEVLKVWDSRTHKELLALNQERSVSGVAWSPDGERMATSGESVIQVWGRLDGSKQLTLNINVNGDSFNSVAWSPDGQHLAVAHWNGAIQIYSMNAKDLMALARGRLSHKLDVSECREYLHVDTCPAVP